MLIEVESNVPWHQLSQELKSLSSLLENDWRIDFSYRRGYKKISKRSNTPFTFANIHCRQMHSENIGLNADGTCLNPLRIVDDVVVTAETEDWKTRLKVAHEENSTNMTLHRNQKKRISPHLVIIRSSSGINIFIYGSHSLVSEDEIFLNGWNLRLADYKLVRRRVYQICNYLGTFLGRNKFKENHKDMKITNKNFTRGYNQFIKQGTYPFQHNL